MQTLMSKEFSSAHFVRQRSYTIRLDCISIPELDRCFMTKPHEDPFALLGIEPRPWVDVAEVSQAFREHARAKHPDAQDGNTIAFQTLTAARDVILDPARRLKLLTERLDGASTPTTGGGAEAADFAFRVSPVLQKMSRLCVEAEKGTGLARALLLREIQDTLQPLADARDEIDQMVATLGSRTRELDTRWPDAVTVNEIHYLAEAWIYTARWRQQLRQIHFRAQQCLTLVVR